MSSAQYQPLVKENEKPPPDGGGAKEAQQGAVISGQSLFFFGILICQSVATQTYFKLSQKGGSYAYNTMSAMAVVEGIKLVISLSQLMLANKGVVKACVDAFKAVERKVYFSYIFLALSYAGYNQLIFHVMKLVDPGTFSLVKSLMPAVVAFLNFFIFGKGQSQAQVLCILIQIFGIVPVTASTNEEGKVDFDYGAKGMAVMLGTIFFSAANSVYNAAVVKDLSAQYPMTVQNSILYAFGFTVNLTSYFISNAGGETGFWHGYNNINVIVLLILNSTVGITISMVYKYGDAVLKTLAQPVTSSVLVFLSWFLFDTSLDIIKLSGAGAVIASTMLYLKVPAPPSSAGTNSPNVKRFMRLTLAIVLFGVVMNADTIFGSGGSSESGEQMLRGTVGGEQQQAADAQTR
ncbi:hypothetical protein ACHAXT_006397 [Thalassiosira profunda]